MSVSSHFEELRVNVSELTVEELRVPEYLQFKEQLMEEGFKVEAGRTYHRTVLEILDQLEKCAKSCSPIDRSIYLDLAYIDG